MDFYDANCFIGRVSAPDGSERARSTYLPAPDAENLVSEMNRAGIKRTIVWHRAQIDASAQLGNRLLAEAITPYENLVGCWTLMPECTGELPPRPDLFHRMREARVRAVKISPKNHLFVANRVSLGALLDDISERNIPVLLSVRKDLTWRQLHDLMADFPKLRVICADHGCWGEDRYFRPLVEQYPFFAIEISNYLLDGGIEAFVNRYGPERMLFGSGFPELYHGGMMLALRHARISEEARNLIASGNLVRMLQEVRLD